ncbi:hypothetical protein GCM10010402_28200 [Actinomadura luteofluorescens]|uniref:CU044_5270 family protein n=1 Tax=Actinomadura luteofluorescens TaxID=46163 RepID=UPI0021641B86|nr:CU044_5270 family protein [Actinomadura glauciflava]MCR3745487.1 hypothetical protein [Actinomadura glauciflava]
MDELSMIREAYGEPAPPTLREMTEARARMFEEPASRRRVQVGWRFRAGLGLVAAGAAVAIAVTVTGSGSPAPPTVDLGKRAVLAAAERAAAQPTGRYWFSDQIQGRSFVMRPESGEYAIVGAHSEGFQWAGARTGDGGAFYGRDLPARPLTPQDAAAWKRAGSPGTFRVWEKDHYSTYTRGTTQWKANREGASRGGTFLVGGRTMTVAQIQGLPTDPGALAKMFFDSGGKAGVPVPAGRPMSPSDKMLVTSDLLELSPLPPKVRAGLMRALAAQPGIRAVGRATDPLGRTGVALAAADEPVRVDAGLGAPPQEQGEYRVRSELVFDRRDGMLLAEQRVLTRPGGAYRTREPGFVIGYWAVRDSGWTDTKPKPPTGLPS